MELKDFKVGQVWRRRDGQEVVLECVDAAFHWPIADDGGGLYSASGAFHPGRENERDLVELVRDIEEPPAQTRLDVQLAGAMQASRGGYGGRTGAVRRDRRGGNGARLHERQ